MKKTSILLFATTTLLLSACGTEGTTDSQPKQATKPSTEQVKVEESTQTQEEVAKETTSKEETKEILVNMDAIKQVKIGMTKEQVIEIAGTDFKETNYMYEGEAGWSLDTPVPKIMMDYSDEALVEGYQFESEFEDEIDIEGIYKQERGSIVEIRLSDKGIVEQVMAYYYNPSDAHLYEYYLFEDGQVKDHAIYPYPEA